MTKAWSYVSESSGHRSNSSGPSKKTKRFTLSSHPLTVSICVLFTLVHCHSFSIPDQQAVLGKLSYFQLPLPKNEIKKIQVTTEHGSGLQSEDWHSVITVGEHLVFVAVPLHEGSYFFHVDAKTTGSEHYEDVFHLKVFKENDEQSRCERTTEKYFFSIDKLWESVKNEIPLLLKHEMQSSKEPLSLMKKWTDNRFTVKAEKAGRVKKFELTRYDCDEMFLGRETPENFKNNVVAEQMIKIYDNPSKHFKRHAPKIHATPTLLADWMTLSPSLLSSHIKEIRPEYQEMPLTRVVPILSSISMNDAPSVVTPSLQNIRMPNTQRRHYSNLIYTTPALFPEPPTGRFDGSLTPIFSSAGHISATPVFTASLAIASTPFYTEHIDSTRPQTSIASDTVTQVDVSSTTTASEDTNTVASPVAPVIGVINNKSPTIGKERIGKQTLTSGKFWVFKIPALAFEDFEDDNARSLDLKFGFENGSTKVPDKHWIYFDSKAQTLFAIPTHKEIGKHVFVITATDSNGAVVHDTVEIHVWQPKVLRKLNHIFTLNSISWSSLEYNSQVKAIRVLFETISSLFPGSSLESFYIHSIVANGSRLSISWTNTTMPLEECPKEEIEAVLKELANVDHPLGASKYKPNKNLLIALSPDFDLESVGLQFIEMCSVVDPTHQTENTLFLKVVKPVNVIPAKFGEVFRFKIPSDMFETNIKRRLDINFLTATGGPVSTTGYVVYDYETQVVTGLAINQNDLSTVEFQIEARDLVSDLKAKDAVKIEFEPIEEVTKNTFEVSLSVIPQHVAATELNVVRKVQLLEHIAMNCMGDSDTRSIKILKLKKYLYNSNSGVFTKIDNLENDISGSDVEDADTEEDQSSKAKARLRRTAGDAFQQHYYEVTWTNSSDVMQSDGACPSGQLQNVFHRIFLNASDDEGVLERLKEKFAPDYVLLHLSFLPVGKCAGYISQREIGSIPVAVEPVTETSSTTTSESENRNKNSIEEYSDEYYLKTIIPAVGTISIMLLVSCVIVIILLRYRQKQEKRKFDVSTANSPEDSYPSETDAFLQKGRTPIIMESELQQHLLTQQNLTSPVILPPKEGEASRRQAAQQMTPMRQLNTSPYQSANTPSQIHAREPPPYHK